MKNIHFEILASMPFGFFKAANLYDLLYLLNLKYNNYSLVLLLK